MFGYVIPNQAALDDEAKARYRTAYCGLCRRIGALHGLRGRLTLSYDLTFLALLLSSLYEGESECVTGSGHCPIHPIRKINWRHSGPTDYCADMSVALHYYNAADKWNDDHSLLGLGFEKLLDSPAQTAAQRWPRQCSAIRTCLDRLAQLEAEVMEDLERFQVQMRNLTGHELLGYRARKKPLPLLVGLFDYLREQGAFLHAALGPGGDVPVVCKAVLSQ